MSTPLSSRAVTGPGLPTPSYGEGGTFSIQCSSRIAATPRDCLDVIINTTDYPTWNRFCRKCTIDSQPNDACTEPHNLTLELGTQFTFDVHLNLDEHDGTPGRPTALEVSVLEPIDEEDDPEDDDAAAADVGRRRKGWRIAWRQRGSLLMPAWMLRSERVQEFVEVNGGSETEYRCWETFYGLLAPVVRLAVGRQVENGFDAWLAGLKRMAEAEKTGQIALFVSENWTQPPSTRLICTVEPEAHNLLYSLSYQEATKMPLKDPKGLLSFRQRPHSHKRDLSAVAGFDRIFLAYGLAAQ
ncbi:hypothetical protein N657DRAFT_670712 [Parathielavia appendiculata]|uniref:Uncharacterized protein n=1 Tax=Parathielavia appendiculata TaxID=2587402 RepID=A0AAN6U2M6_9PEZI|nr:hypothetical protein N657DRAFT_670712 [Parathielavia appendiculata]